MVPRLNYFILFPQKPQDIPKSASPCVETSNDNLTEIICIDTSDSDDDPVLLAKGVFPPTIPSQSSTHCKSALFQFHVLTFRYLLNSPFVYSLVPKTSQ